MTKKLIVFVLSAILLAGVIAGWVFNGATASATVVGSQVLPGPAGQGPEETPTPVEPPHPDSPPPGIEPPFGRPVEPVAPFDESAEPARNIPLGATRRRSRVASTVSGRRPTATASFTPRRIPTLPSGLAASSR